MPITVVVDDNHNRIRQGQPARELWRLDLESGEYYDAYVAVLRTLHAGHMHLDAAARRLASEVFTKSDDQVSGNDEEDDDDLEDSLGALWGTILEYAREYPSSQAKLVALLLHIAALPDAAELSNKHYSERIVWCEMPVLLGEFVEEWNRLKVPKQDGPGREKAITRWHDANRFAALLMKSRARALNTDQFALWTFKSALETPADSVETKRDLDIDVPAAAIWIEEVGDMIFQCESEFPPYRGTRPGIGGPLWDGKHGFCRGRWDLWRRRFGEVSVLEGVSDSSKMCAEKAAVAMARIAMSESTSNSSANALSEAGLQRAS